MKKVLLASELGGGLGHVGRLLSIANELAKEGHHPVLAVRDLHVAFSLLNTVNWETYQAPIHLKQSLTGFASSSHADLLMKNGFAKTGELLPLVNAWQTLVETINPSLIIADHSPVLCLAARGIAPVVSIGTGYTLPPIEFPEFPRLREDVPITAPQSHLFSVIQNVQNKRQLPCPETVTGIFNTDRRLLCTLPELDPYQSIRKEVGIGPIGELPKNSPVPLEPSVFVYASPDYPALDILGACLADLDIPVHAYILGDAGVFSHFLERRGIRVYREPPKLAEMLPQISAIIHHGGNYTAHAAMIAGRPQLVLPRFYEAALNGRMLESLGICEVLESRITMERLKKAMRNVLYEPDISGQAVRHAEVIQKREPLNGLQVAVETCLDLLS